MNCLILCREKIPLCKCIGYAWLSYELDLKEFLESKVYLVNQVQQLERYGSMSFKHYHIEAMVYDSASIPSS